MIDLRAGCVVHARRGERERYQPVASRLVVGSEPVAVARALVATARADTLYVADLDAIAGAPVQREVLRALGAALTGVTLWLDAGFEGREAAWEVTASLGGARIVPVYGSESLRSLAELRAIASAQARGEPAVLSLDARGDTRLDRAGCWQAPAWWPRELIVMTLARVGSDAGPDLAAIRAMRAQAPAARLVGAGGIRHAQDLAEAGQAGADAWLVASALHEGRLAV